MFLIIMWLVFTLEIVFNINLKHFGIFPRSVNGIVGVIAGPFIHANFEHIFNNSIPLLILGTALFYFYKEIALKVFLWAFFMVGLWTWSSAREAFHIGASGVLYALFSFILFSGFIRKNTNLIALSFFVAFLYGSMIWGIFPIDFKISFEGHFWGFAAGIILAFYFRKQGPQIKKYEWEDEDDDGDEMPYWKQSDQVEINYTIKD